MSRGSSAVLCGLAQSGWRLASLPRALRFQPALDAPEVAQRRALERIVRRNADTAYGRAHGFHSVRSLDAWRERVPVVGYEDLEPWIERARRGEQGVLTAEPIRRLVPSSGSTSARKLIPWTRSLAAEWRRALEPWVWDLFRRHPGLVGGPAYWSVSPAIAPDTDGGAGAVPVGFDDDSAYLGGVLRPLVRFTLAVPEEVRRVQDPEIFRYVTALALLRARELRLVSAWHPSFFALLLDTVARHWEALVRDVADGTVTPPGPAALPAPLLARLRGRRDRTRARELMRAGPFDTGRVWPRLRVVSCWADGPAAGPARALMDRLPGVALQAKGLLATEGVVTVPFAGTRPVAVRSHVVELLDADDRARSLADAVEGESYGVALTTAGGLYRYRLGDRVRVDGFLGRTPCLRFVGREDRVADLRGEKLAEGFVAEVLQRLLGSALPRFAMLAPDRVDDVPAYTLYVHVAEPLSADLAGRLDEALSANPHYALCRRLGQLGPTAIYRIREDADAVVLKRARRMGARMGDVKPAALSPHDDWSSRFEGEYV